MSGVESGPAWAIMLGLVLLGIFVHFFRAERRWLRKRDEGVRRLIREAYDEDEQRKQAFPFDQECQ